jgi:hypothetical protein
VLGVPETDLAFHIGKVGTLLQEVERAAEETEKAAFEPIPGHLRSLANSILPQARPLAEQVGTVAPDASALQLLASLSAYLSLGASEGPTPDEDEVAALREHVRELIDEVSGSGLSPEVKRALLHRLAEMLEALEHLATGGPEGVRRAAEALAALAVIYSEGEEDAATLDKIKRVAKGAWTLFTEGARIVAALHGWDHLVHPQGLLDPPSEPPALPPGSPDDP